MSAFTDKVKRMPKAKPRQPLWAGPEDSGPMGGITQSMINILLGCPERARLRLIEGWSSAPRFNPRMDYGTMWHACEEEFAKSGQVDKAFDKLHAVTKQFTNQFKLQQQEIVHWYNTCKTQFPIYVDYWRKHPDMKKREPLLQEEIFHVPYELPSGRTVYLRGKFDSVDLIDRRMWLQENKTMGDIQSENIERRLAFDLQTMLYLIALEARDVVRLPNVIAGVRYNVVRRPFAGGKGSIRKSEGTKGAKCPKCSGEGHYPDKIAPKMLTFCQKCGGSGRINAKPPETDEEFYGRLSAIIEEDPSYWFLRWNVEIGPRDIEKFKTEFLNPFLETVCGMYYCWRDKDSPQTYAAYPYRQPYGIWNAMTDGGGGTDLDELLATGNTVGLVRRVKLFTELEE